MREERTSDGSNDCLAIRLATNTGDLDLTSTVFRLLAGISVPSSIDGDDQVVVAVNGTAGTRYGSKNG